MKRYMNGHVASERRKDTRRERENRGRVPNVQIGREKRASAQIRAADEDDVPIVLQLTKDAYAEYAPDFGPAWAPYLHMLELAVTGANAKRLVADEDGRVVGSVLLFLPGSYPGYQARGSTEALDIPEIRFLAVSHLCRGRGVGEAIMQAAIEDASHAGHPPVGLHTISFMTAARRLYAKLGFLRDERADFTVPPGLLVEGYRLELNARSDRLQ